MSVISRQHKARPAGADLTMSAPTSILPGVGLPRWLDGLRPVVGLCPVGARIRLVGARLRPVGARIRLVGACVVAAVLLVGCGGAQPSRRPANAPGSRPPTPAPASSAPQPPG